MRGPLPCQTSNRTQDFGDVRKDLQSISASASILDPAIDLEVGHEKNNKNARGRLDNKRARLLCLGLSEHLSPGVHRGSGGSQ